MGKRVDLRVVKTKEIFYESMICLMEEKPFGKIKTIDVIRHANVAKNTFYKYYDTVYDLYHEMIEETVKEITAFYHRPLGYQLDDVCAFVTLITKHERIWRIAFKDTSPNVLESIFLKYIAPIEELHDSAETASQPSMLKLELLQNISVSMIIATIPYYLENKNRPIEEVAAEIRDTIKQYGKYCFTAYDE